MTDFSLIKGGNCRYYGDFLTPELSYALARELLLGSVTWVTETFKIFGKETSSPRMLSSMFDPLCPTPTLKKGKKPYWKQDSAWVQAGKRSWTPLMEYVKNHIEKSFGVKIWYAQLNHYRTGKDYIGFHSDSEMADNDIVFSISLGNRRRFCFRPKEQKTGPEERELYLQNGSLIMFDANAGKNNYKHTLPEVRQKDFQDNSFGYGRINITFRTMNSN